MQLDNIFKKALASHQTGQLDQAAKLYRLILNTDGEHAQAFNNLGAIFMSCDRLNDALVCFQNAINARADFFEAHINLARAFKKLGDFARAVASFRSVLRIKPDYVPAYLDLSFLYHKLDDHSSAISCCRRALELDPLSVDACNNLGNALSSSGDFPAAIESFNRAIHIQPNRADLYYNLANVLKSAGQAQSAIENYRRALVLDPEYVDARWNLSHALLFNGNFQEGWLEYECRFKLSAWQDIYPFRLNAPRWDGSPFKNRRLLVHDEQGLGDTLQFIRFLPLVKALGGTVIFETRRPLLRLLKGLCGVDELIARSSSPERAVDFDMYIPLMSVPALLGTTLLTVPSKVPYLYADPPAAARWRQRFEGSNLYVGIVWSGNPRHGNDRNRSCSLEMFRELAEVGGVELIGLQADSTATKVESTPSEWGLKNLGREFKDFSDTAAVISALDLVISVDTAVAHLAGAMGKAVWLLLPYSPDWRWLAKGSDSPWYPTMRLYRQPDPGNWKAAFQRVNEQLIKMATRH